MNGHLYRRLAALALGAAAAWCLGATPAAAHTLAPDNIAASAGVTATKTVTRAAAAKPAAPAAGFVNAAPIPFRIAATLPVTINIDSVYARNAPRWQAGLVNRLLKHHPYTAVARDGIAEWLLIVDGTSRQWIHKDMARIDGDRTALPVAEGAFSPGVLPNPRVPGVPALSSAARALYQTAVRSGRDPYLATVVGDCNSEGMVFFGRFGAGGFSLYGSGQTALRGTATKWARSFTRASVATHGSFSSATAQDPTWSDPKQCQPGENPVECELRRSNASVVFLSVGTGDQFSWQGFEANYRRMIDTAISRKVLPVLVTKADDLEALQGGAPPDTINAVIRRLGAEYKLPVMDFWAATRGLPQFGLVNEVVETPQGLRDQGNQRFHLSDAGMNMRILQALLTLRNIAS